MHIESVNPLSGHPGDIIVSPSGEHGFVSIDGKRTYLNLFGGSTPTPVQSSSATIKPTACNYNLHYLKLYLVFQTIK